MVIKKIEFVGIDEVLYTDVTDNGLEIYMWVNEKINNYYMTYTTKFGSLDTEFKIGKKSYKVPDGIAHFLEHIKFHTKDGGTANDFYNKYGISINAFTSFDLTAYEVYGSSHFNEALQYLIEYVGTPVFSDDAIKKECGIINEEIKMGLDDPGRQLYFGAYEAIFHHDKHQISITGEISDIESITLDDINLVFDTFYHPKNMFVTITGNFNPYEASAIIKDQIGKMNYKPYTNYEIINEVEPLKIVDKVKTIYGNVENEKVKIVYKIAKSAFKGMSDVDIRTHLSVILRNNFGSTSVLREELLSNELITGLSYSREIIGDYVIVVIAFESKYIDEVTKMIVDTYNNLELDEVAVRRRIRANIASLINQFDDIEYVNSEIQDNVIAYGRVMTEMFNIYNGLNYDDIVSTIKYLKTDNYSVVKLLKNK